MASHPCSGADPVVTVDVHAARHFLRSGHRYLDVRTEEEFKKGHVENSLNIPYMFNTPQGRVKNPNFLEQVSAACGKEEKLVVGCQSGVRSLHATTDLLIAEFKHVSNMGGGYQAWVESGFAVNKPQDEL
ncbi:PREDICTED: rhodanese-like domain-containing protein 19, mitochondrial isoform X4 [Nicotiana attenuata]|uniref:Rhodanese-like domain-containing protein 19, mitochondrial n=1 Tax=Nicotiana attenuata TaxID=49451 RepID=A0A314LAM4_NICAT|nr:PREDICTED: rhodanese-like domain-containing protein 19, mitochondrial isoform X4 [Nicotiana attenuata]OIT38740.1 rhodanese-like domain-containing protein 19, mitochondrial [Nicotiana attenuata]